MPRHAVTLHKPVNRIDEAVQVEAAAAQACLHSRHAEHGLAKWPGAVKKKGAFSGLPMTICSILVDC